LKIPPTAVGGLFRPNLHKRAQVGNQNTTNRSWWIRSYPAYDFLDDLLRLTLFVFVVVIRGIVLHCVGTQVIHSQYKTSWFCHDLAAESSIAWIIKVLPPSSTSSE
jgi:hypothetical protein